uniref:Phosphatidylinositol transfer protein 1-like n=1 Tax=Nicotiana tabacum TaxID=4097 RepID=A0A1S3YFG9_TOBAC|nr:PREDICTED: phosphatidylinositol transfer protein 1-like [Nicotiana tabacum]
MYVVMKMQQQSTTGNEGVEVLQNRPFTDVEFGEGQYTSKIYRFQSKAPTWLTKFASPNALAVREDTWNAYPKCRSVIKCPGFSKFLMTVDTVHKADNGYSENVHGLSKQQLAARQVEVIDIASAASDYWNYIVGRSTVDFSKFKSARTGRGPLLKGWKDQCSPVMTAYKLVTIDIPYWGFGGKLEQALMALQGLMLGWMFRIRFSLNFSTSYDGVDASRPPSVPSTLLRPGADAEVNAFLRLIAKGASNGIFSLRIHPRLL